jgi:integrase
MLNLALAVPEYGLSVNPATAAKVPKNAAKRVRDPQWLTYTQARALLDQCWRERYWGPYFIVCALLGLRPGEGFGLRWSDIDHDRGMVRVQSALKRENDRPMFLGPIKNDDDGRRRVKLPLDAIHALKRQQEIIDTFQIEPADERWDGLIFLTDKGVPPFMSSVRKALLAVIKRANAGLPTDEQIPPITPYDLRHTCATILLLDAKIDIEEVARMLGTSSTMLREHYRHYGLDNVSDSLADAWDTLPRR